MLAGQRDPICILDLAEIRLQPDTWQQYINDGLFSITYTPPYQPLAEVFESADDGFGNFDEPIHIIEALTPILPAPKHTLTLEQATLAQSDRPEPGQIQDNQTEYTQMDQTNTTEHLQIQAVQTQTQTNKSTWTNRTGTSTGHGTTTNTRQNHRKIVCRVHCSHLT